LHVELGVNAEDFGDRRALSEKPLVLVGTFARGDKSRPELRAVDTLVSAARDCRPEQQ
jgi:hypothetical protein